MTNFDRVIMNISPEQLACGISDWVDLCERDCPLKGECDQDEGCIDNILNWLKEEEEPEGAVCRCR